MACWLAAGTQHAKAGQQQEPASVAGGLACGLPYDDLTSFWVTDTALWGAGGASFINTGQKQTLENSPDGAALYALPRRPTKPVCTTGSAVALIRCTAEGHHWLCKAQGHTADPIPTCMPQLLPHLWHKGIGDFHAAHDDVSDARSGSCKANTAGAAAQQVVDIRRTPELTPSRESSSLPTLRLQKSQHSMDIGQHSLT